MDGIDIFCTHCVFFSKSLLVHVKARHRNKENDYRFELKKNFVWFINYFFGQIERIPLFFRKLGLVGFGTVNYGRLGSVMNFLLINEEILFRYS